jgi:hypothetical protein
MDQNVPGTVLSYLGEDTPDGWIICNGLAQINTNNKYKNLIEMNIGSIDKNDYIPPNYMNMKLISTNELDKKLIKNNCESYNGHLHVFNKQNAEDEHYYYYSIPKPLFLSDNNYAKWLSSCFKLGNVSQTIKWIIKY